MPYWFVLALLIIATPLVWRGFKRGRELEYLPTIGWAVTIMGPYLVQAPLLPPGPTRLQGWGIMTIGAVFLLGDTVFSDRRPLVPFVPSSPTPGLAYIGALAFLVLTMGHLLVVPSIPLVEVLVGERDQPLLLAHRQAFSQDLQVPFVLKYVFNWVIPIFAPLAIASLAFVRHFVLSAMSVVWAYFYAAASLAKFSVLYLTVVLGVIVLVRADRAVRQKILVVGLSLLLIILVGNAALLYQHPASLFNYEPAPSSNISQKIGEGDSRRYLSIGDHLRLRPLETTESMSTYEQSAEYIFYRFFLTPTDVANRWYAYFPEVSGGFEGFATILPWLRPEEWSHPANRVAVWAYVERFPEKYRDFAHAYASIDADAFARMGVLGWAVAASMLLLIRWGLKFLRSPDQIGDTLYYCGIVMFALLPAHASIQAILVAHGLGVVLGLQVLHWVWRNHEFVRRQKHNLMSKG